MKNTELFNLITSVDDAYLYGLLFRKLSVFEPSPEATPFKPLLTDASVRILRAIVFSAERKTYKKLFSFFSQEILTTTEEGRSIVLEAAESMMKDKENERWLQDNFFLNLPLQKAMQTFFGVSDDDLALAETEFSQFWTTKTAPTSNPQ